MAVPKDKELGFHRLGYIAFSITVILPENIWAQKVAICESFMQ
jgi:hypothetical protein